MARPECKVDVPGKEIPFALRKCIVEIVILAAGVSIAVPVAYCMTNRQHLSKMFGMDDRFNRLFVSRIVRRCVHRNCKIEQMLPVVVFSMRAFFKSPAIGLWKQRVPVVIL